MISATTTVRPRSASPKVWRLLPHDPAAIRSLSTAIGVSPIVAQLLLNRKIVDPQLAKKFLGCPLADLHEPELLPGLDAAIDRILAAIRRGDRICIYGDYDVDGVTGTAILATCLKHLGVEVDYHIPHRVEEGYGLSSDTLRKLAAAGIRMIVTVDCGIASLDEAVVARQLGLELIVTDHHEPKSTLPCADVLVHPRLPIGAATYPFDGLCGAGVAFKLAWGLAKKHCGGSKVSPALREFLLDAIVLAAMGTVADVVPLFGENRILVRHGLVRMRKQPTRGMLSLLRFAKLNEKSSLAAMDIGYSIAPRINAAGRLGTAKLAVELLMTHSAERADIIAGELERHNSDRQLMERRMLGEARDMAASAPIPAAFVLAQRNWHPGLLGIVASRLVDEYARPALMISLQNEALAQGSGRSIPGFPLHEALQECTGHLISHGGHAVAAGFRLQPGDLDRFREGFCAVAHRRLGDSPPRGELKIDAEVPFLSLTSNLMLTLEQMEPFGSGNPPPVLLADDLQVVGEPKVVGATERHVSFKVRQQSREIKAIGFNLVDRLGELMSQEGRCCLAFTPRLNEWNGYKSVEIVVKDFQPGPKATLGG
jgi:single-stranded-DNA-specific exonuclease